MEADEFLPRTDYVYPRRSYRPQDIWRRPWRWAQPERHLIGWVARLMVAAALLYIWPELALTISFYLLLHEAGHVAAYHKLHLRVGRVRRIALGIAVQTLDRRTCRDEVISTLAGPAIVTLGALAFLGVGLLFDLTTLLAIALVMALATTLDLLPISWPAVNIRLDGGSVWRSLHFCGEDTTQTDLAFRLMRPLSKYQQFMCWLVYGACLVLMSGTAALCASQQTVFYRLMWWVLPSFLLPVL